MSDALTCKGCQKRYVWKAQYAGRKVKCRCGQVLLMPAVDPNAPSGNQNDQPTSQPAVESAGQSPAQPMIQPLGQPESRPLPAFELMDETPAPRPSKTKPVAAPFEMEAQDTQAKATPKASPGISMEDDDLMPIGHDQGAGTNTGAIASAADDDDLNAGQNDDSQDADEDTFELAVDPDALDTGPKISNSSLAAALSAKPSAVAAALENREDEVTLSPWKEKYIPAAIAIIGVLVHIALWFFFAADPKHAAIGAAGMMVVEIFVLMPIAIAAVFLTARIMNIGFGPMIPALLKVAAIAIGTGGVADILFFKMMLSVDFDYTMLLVAFVLHMLLLGLPILAIFELELSEMVMIVAIIVVPRIVILFGMGWLFPEWF